MEWINIQQNTSHTEDEQMVIKLIESQLHILLFYAY